MALNYHLILFSIAKRYLRMRCSLKTIFLVRTKNGWMTADLMENWVKKVWERHPGGLRNPPSMLVLDVFHRHLPEQLKVKWERKKCDLVVFPDGMTSQIQPLGVSVNKSF
jgi:hypothetical protein